MNRSRLDMNMARDKTMTIAVIRRGLGACPSSVGAIVWRLELTVVSPRFVRNLDLR
jgi:hypothetical protein